MMNLNKFITKTTTLAKSYLTRSNAAQTLCMFINKLEKIKSGKYKDVERNMEHIRLRSLDLVTESDLDGGGRLVQVNIKPYDNKYATYFDKPRFHIYAYTKITKERKARSFYWNTLVGEKVKEANIHIAVVESVLEVTILAAKKE